MWCFDFTGLASLQGTGADSNGLYLIRDSTSSDKDFVVSVTHDAKVFHFQIKEVFDGHYKLDEGPTTQGQFVVGFKAPLIHFWNISVLLIDINWHKLKYITSKKNLYKLY